MILNKRLRIYKMVKEKKGLTIDRYFTSNEKSVEDYFD